MKPTEAPQARALIDSGRLLWLGMTLLVGVALALFVTAWAVLILWLLELARSQGGVVQPVLAFLLTMVFRSVAVPLKATLGYLLSVLAAFGVVTAVFENGIAAFFPDFRGFSQAQSQHFVYPLHRMYGQFLFHVLWNLFQIFDVVFRNQHMLDATTQSRQ